MNANREGKLADIEVVRDRAAKASSWVLLDFKGIDVEIVTALRAQFRKAGVEYRVLKNTLIKQALKGTPLEGNSALAKALTGQTGVAWSYEDPSAAAKVVKAFRKENEKHEKLGVKCGILDNSVLAGERVESELATMPGKNELRAMLLATLQAPAQNLVRLLQAPAQNFNYLLAARERQQHESK